MGDTTPYFLSIENPYRAPVLSSDKLVVGAVESGSGGTGFDSRRARVTFGIDFWSCRGDFFMALGMCGEWSGDVLGGVGEGGEGVGKSRKSCFSKMSGSICPASGASQ